MRFFVLALSTVSLIVLLLRRSRAFRARAAVPVPRDAIGPDDPDRTFHDRAVAAGFRYVGERNASFMSAFHVTLPKEGERLLARIPLVENEGTFELERNIHRQRCDDAACRGRMFGLYATGPECELDHRFYGPVRAYEVGEACGTCLRVRARCDIPTYPPRLIFATDFRDAFGGVRAFLDGLSG